MAKNVKVYSVPVCSHCAATRKFLKVNNIQFENIDISGNPESSREMIKKSGQLSVPVIDIDGEIVVGFDERKIKQALGL